MRSPSALDEVFVLRKRPTYYCHYATNKHCIALLYCAPSTHTRADPETGSEG